MVNHEVSLVSVAEKRSKTKTKGNRYFQILIFFHSCPKELLKEMSDNIDYTSPTWKYFVKKKTLISIISLIADVHFHRFKGIVM